MPDARSKKQWDPGLLYLPMLLVNVYVIYITRSDSLGTTIEIKNPLGTYILILAETRYCIPFQQYLHRYPIQAQ